MNTSFPTVLRTTTTTSVYSTMSIVSDSNTTGIPGEHCPKNQDTKFENSVKILLYVIAMLVSLIGNTLLIYSVKKRKRMRTVTNFLIVNMAVADLFITVFNMPTYLKILITQKNDWIGGPLGILSCKLVLFIQGVSVTCSVLSLTVLTIHRFVSVLYPWKKLIDTRNVKYIIIAIWIASCAFISPLLYALNVIPTDNEGLVCDEKWSPLFDEEEAPKTYTIVLFVLLYMAPLLIMAVLYTALILKLWFQSSPDVSASACRRQSEEALSIARVFSDEKAKSSRSSRSKKIVLKMLVTVVVVFALCWLPMHIRVFLYFFNKDDYKCGLPPFLDFIGYFLGHVNSALNPWIYVTFSESYRQSFKAVLFNRCAVRRKPKLTRHYHYKGACLVEMQKLRTNIKHKK